jgi:hypothetical protein
LPHGSGTNDFFARGVGGHQQLVIVGERRRSERILEGVVMPELLKGTHISTEQAELAGCPSYFLGVLRLCPALGLAVQGQAGLVQIEQVEGGEADVFHRL